MWKWESTAKSGVKAEWMFPRKVRSKQQLNFINVHKNVCMYFPSLILQLCWLLQFLFHCWELRLEMRKKGKMKRFRRKFSFREKRDTKAYVGKFINWIEYSTSEHKSDLTCSQCSRKVIYALICMKQRKNFENFTQCMLIKFHKLLGLSPWIYIRALLFH